MSASSVDPDIQAAFGGTSPSASSHANVDSDILDAFKSSAETSENKLYTATDAAKGVLSTIGNTAMNIPYTAVHGAANLGRKISGNADAPQSAFESMLQFKPDADQQRLGQQVSKLIPQRSGTNQPDDTATPDVSPTTRDIADKTLGVIGDVSSIAPLAAMGVKGVKAFIPETAEGLEAGHPLSGAAQSEIEDMQTHANAAEAAGVKLPPRQVTPAQAYVNDAARRDLNLPKNAPITDGLLDQAKKLNVSPAYEAAKNTPAYDLGPNYQAAIGKVNLDKIDPEWRPPTDGKMTGQQAVDLSGQLRSVARGMYEDADNYNLTYAQRADARTTAQAHYQAAKAVEGGFREGSGAADIADAWDAARVYNAKTEAWRGALDGAGNVSGPKIKKLLADEPVSGPMKEVGSVVAQYPELFRSTRLQTPQEGMLKKGIRGVAPIAGAAAGEMVAPGTLGSMGGAALGEYAAQKFLGPSR